MTSLVVPVTPRALGESLEARRTARLRSSERAARERSLSSSLASLRTTLDTSRATWHAARQRRDAAGLALDDVARQYRSGAGRTSVEHLLGARDDLSRAEHAELEAHAPWLQACARLQLLERQRGASRRALTVPPASSARPENP
jgi:hypothetical protein